jgi:hypothetical protein
MYNVNNLLFDLYFKILLNYLTFFIVDYSLNTLYNIYF